MIQNSTFTFLDKLRENNTSEWFKANEEEYREVKKHTIYGFDLLRKQEDLSLLSAHIALQHHERWDGTGYPQGLKGKEIPLVARIFAVIDVFNAITSERPYSKPWQKEKAIEYVREQSGKHFDPDVVQAFLKHVDRFY